MMVQMGSLRSSFLLVSEVIFLNHGSFGAVPLPVMDVYQGWQREMEKQPVEFLGRKITSHLAKARDAIGEYLHTDKDNLVFVPNTTHGINIVARSLHLSPGDEILTSDHEYGAMDRTWRFLNKKSGAIYKQHRVALPVDDPDEFVDAFFSDVGPRTRVIFLSHITSPTAIIFPIREICHRARELGILTVIDGAHAPGQIPLDLDDLQADFYSGNFHKWLCAPKGAAFLFARPQVQKIIEPLAVSWGYEADVPGPSTFQDVLEWTGTQDFSAYLSVPAAIEYQATNEWRSVQLACHDLAAQNLECWRKISKLPQLYTSDRWFAQMAALPVPTTYPAAKLKSLLMDKYQIEIPVIEWEDRMFLRLSVQAYNTGQEMDYLIRTLCELFNFHA